ncbi:hypothetical protein RclHR1_01470007 [Rhizophagus clarus]|uniref:Uncharacterized protein n=1 Tax=Rhizophagus clarus TaxID=94130 RepID=A0A2Z6QQQ1_9GLOM|nr:hypothetical protein RclHR1_01470007 [Rhizophagus clarus]
MDEIEVEPQNNTLAIKIPDENPKDDIFVKTEKHRESICRIFVSQYMNDTTYNKEYGSDDYVVTYSEKDQSILGWSVNIEMNGPQQPDPDVYFKVDEQYKIFFDGFLQLNRKIFLWDERWPFDLNDKRPLKLEYPINPENEWGFLNDVCGLLPNGDLIRVSLSDRKIYKYCSRDKSKNMDSWKYSQINDMEIPESLYDQITHLSCTICRTKLFLFVETRKVLILQFDLFTMDLERQYTTDIGFAWSGLVIMNKDQTLFAIRTQGYICIFSMENGMLISKHYCDVNNSTFEFITLNDNSERLVILSSDDCKLVDPYQAYDDINISDDFNYETNMITKLNRKIFIDDNNNICVTDGLDIINKNSIYTLSTFKIIRSMLNEIIDKVNIEKVVLPEYSVIKDEVDIKNIGLCKLVLRTCTESHDPYVTCSGILYLENNGSDIRWYSIPHILSCKFLNNQDLVLINMGGIDIYTINEDGFRRRYFWYNSEWEDIYRKFDNNAYDIDFTNEHYKPLIGKILENEFGDSKHSIIPLPSFTKPTMVVTKNEIAEDIINDNLASSKFGIEMLEIAIKEKETDIARQIITKLSSKSSKFAIEMLEVAIKEKYHDVVRQIIIDVSSKFGIETLGTAINEKYHDVVLQIINRTIESIQDYSENYMTSISLNLSELCHRYPDFIIKYISYTSIILSPFCNGIRNSKNTSLHSYTNIYIKESNMDKNVFKSISALYKRLFQHLKIEEEIQTVSFVVPFPRICVYKDEIEDNHDNQSKIITILKKIMMIPGKNDNPWNEFLYKPKSILFCNIDSNHLYNWWNFAAIIDFKWKTFGRVYYYLSWLFYAIFYVCYSLASTLEQKSIPDFYFELLFIISIIFGSLFLIFEIRHCLWDYKIYFNDIWNLFVLGYAQAFFIVLRSTSINDDNDPRNVATKYDFVNPDGSISNATTMIQDPDSNTNLFNWFPTSLLAVYNLLTGDSGSVSSFTYREHSVMTILLVTFTFFTVIYLMNLFIGLLNLAIDDYKKEEEFLLQKAQIIMEIELFYMLPYQKRNKKWFPDWIYYDMPVTEIRKLINAIDNNQTVFNYPPFISEKLREIVVLTNGNKKQDNKNEQDNDKEQSNEEKQDNEEEQNNKLEKRIEQTKEELTKQNVELKQQNDDLKQQMDKLKEQMESIMELLSKTN